MAERLKKIPKQLLDIWKKYTSKQKTLIISVACVVILAFALLIFLMQRVSYTELITCESAKEASQVGEVLKGEGIKYKIDKNSMVVSVETKSSTDAMLLLAKNDLPSNGITMDQLLNNSLSTTNADRTLKINLYFQNELRNKIKEMEGIEDAVVYYIPKDNSQSILSKAEDTSASVLLTVNDKFKQEEAKTIAEVVAYTIGNENSEKIKVADQYGNLLYGGDKDLYSGTASSNEDFKERLRNTIINNLYPGLLKSGYDDAEIMPNLVLDMDKVSEMYTEYTPAEGQDQGLYSYSKTYKSENAGTSGGGEPGTSSNDETTYQIQDSTTTNGTVESQEYNYLPNQKVTNTEYEIGAVIPDKSTIGIVLRSVKSYRQEDLEKDGTLDGTTFDAYVQQNSALKPITVDPSVLPLVSKATGIAEANITITAFEQPLFVPKTTTPANWTLYLQIALAVLIVGLLGFIVFKGVRPVEVTELEPELSVEQLLATTKENQSVDEIEFNEVSEVRRMIEKFVDEKPEAVAQLLRNWLNEDWS